MFYKLFFFFIANKKKKKLSCFLFYIHLKYMFDFMQSDALAIVHIAAQTFTNILSVTREAIFAK